MTAAALKSGSKVLVSDGQYRLTQKNFDAIAAILHRETGIFLSPAKVQLVYSRLAKRLRKLGLNSFDDYCQLIDTSAGAEELLEMLAALTTNVTRFFREPHHFEHLRDRVMPKLVSAAKRGESIRIWSSACSSGEEPYSIALTMLSAFPDCANHDVKILATDIDPHMVARGAAATYSSRDIETVPAADCKKWFSKTDDPDRWRVRDEVRSLVSFKQLNLVRDWPMKRPFDVIFCRNVVIYFQEDTQAAIWDKFYAQMKPSARLYIGHSERIESTRFQSDGLTIYRRRDGE